MTMSPSDELKQGLVHVAPTGRRVADASRSVDEGDSNSKTTASKSEALRQDPQNTASQSSVEIQQQVSTSDPTAQHLQSLLEEDYSSLLPILLLELHAKIGGQRSLDRKLRDVKNGRVVSLSREEVMYVILHDHLRTEMKRDLAKKKIFVVAFGLLLALALAFV